METPPPPPTTTDEAMTLKDAVQHLWSCLHPSSPPPLPSLPSLSHAGTQLPLSSTRTNDADAQAVPSSFAVSTAALLSLAAVGLAAAHLLDERTGPCVPAPAVAVDCLDAAREFRSNSLAAVVGVEPPALWDPLNGAYATANGRFVRVHTNFAHHRDVLTSYAVGVAGSDTSRDDIAAALASVSGSSVESAIVEAGGVAGFVRTLDEWAGSEQALATEGLAPIVSEPLLCPLPDSGEQRTLAPIKADAADGAARPLAGVRVVDCTRVIAGPVCGRDLAYYGADVLRITSPNLPHVPACVADVGRGKRSAFVDLDTADGVASLEALVADADVFINGYRPGALAARGFDLERLRDLRPDLVVVDLSAYSHVGPWASRRGFDSILQAATGLNAAEAAAAGVLQPKPFPFQVLDHATGHLLAAAVMAALAERQRTGLGAHIRGSLLQTRNWLVSLGRVPDGLSIPEPAALSDPAALLVSPCDPALGGSELRHTAHAVALNGTAPLHTVPSAPLGSSPPAWW